jgi:hypothetical protein
MIAPSDRATAPRPLTAHSCPPQNHKCSRKRPASRQSSPAAEPSKRRRTNEISENSEPTRARPQDPDNDDSRNAPAEHITNSPTAEHQDARDADKEKDSSGTRPRKIASRFHMTAERARMFRQRQEAEDAEREERLRLLSLQ